MAFRGQLRTRWTPLFFGLLCGLIASTTLVYAWNRPYNNDDAMFLLGSGKGLSALVTADGMRVVIASGNDPIAFANALADARPLTAPRVDLLIVTPGSERVAARAKEITKPAMVLEIVSADAEPEPSGHHLTRARETIALGNDMTLVLDPGIIIGSPLAGWSIEIQARGTSILLVEQLPLRPVIGSMLIAVMSNQFDVPREPPTGTIAVSSLVGDDETSTTFPLGLVDPGYSVKIPIGPGTIEIPGSWKDD
jgi:hypothetical protein